MLCIWMKQCSFDSLDAFNSNLEDEANTHVVPFDAAFPGTLPVSLCNKLTSTSN
jgi:Asp-tRNA(Asn)/Glu-tRNA(Gln) amidotransferase B subunit